MFSNGPPKQAEKAMRGYPILANTYSLVFHCQLTIANTVNPRIASLIPNMIPNARKTPTTSLATKKIHVMDTINPTNAKTSKYLGGFSSVLVR
ncbi:hypothetical protein BGZ76_011704 [Entomortierella beljakovae]|nr:hypothetical protein BGZ76_011704 [Entomortierella beljakovae]